MPRKTKLECKQILQREEKFQLETQRGCNYEMITIRICPMKQIFQSENLDVKC